MGATVSSGRARLVNISAMGRSISSPGAWPARSLTALLRSRSMNSAAARLARRAAPGGYSGEVALEFATVHERAGADRARRATTGARRDGRGSVASVKIQIVPDSTSLSVRAAARPAGGGRLFAVCSVNLLLVDLAAFGEHDGDALAKAAVKRLVGADDGRRPAWVIEPGA